MPEQSPQPSRRVFAKRHAHRSPGAESPIKDHHFRKCPVCQILVATSDFHRHRRACILRHRFRSGR